MYTRKNIGRIQILAGIIIILVSVYTLNIFWNAYNNSMYDVFDLYSEGSRQYYDEHNITVDDETSFQVLKEIMALTITMNASGMSLFYSLNMYVIIMSAIGAMFILQGLVNIKD